MSDVTVKDHDAADDVQAESLRGQHHPTKPWQAEIDVTLTSAGPPAEFQIQTCLPVDENGNIIFGNNGRPGFNLTFRLYDNTNNNQGSGYAFPQGVSEADAVWSVLGQSGCPSEGAWEVFPKESISVEDEGATLVVSNPNPGPTPQGNFRYTLNVVKAGTTSYVAIDPGGTNNNGGTSQ